MGRWMRRLAYLLRQSHRDAELLEEIEAHRAMRAEDLARNGLTLSEASAASRRALGNVLLAREDAREIWLGSSTLWQDIRYGLRTFRRHPTFTAAAVLTLALGIGVNTGIFTVVNAVLFRNLPVPRSDQLLSISQTVSGLRGDTMTGSGTFSTAEYMAYRDRARTLSGLVASANSPMTILGGDTPRVILGKLVSCNYFDVLQQPAARGRSLTARDCEPGAQPVVVLNHQLWMTTFSGDPGVVGRPVQLNGQPFTVVGVGGPDTYSGALFGSGYFAPISAEPLLRPDNTRYASDTNRWLTLVGRRTEESGTDRVGAELAVIASQIDVQVPGRQTRLTVTRAKPDLGGGAPGAPAAIATVLMAAFGCLLLIACANVANLMLARASSRTQEMAIRLSLGATRARMVRQLLTESLLIAVAGGILGSLLAAWSFQGLVALALPALMPPGLPFSPTLDVSPDVRVLFFAIALTVVTGVLFGLAPALHISKPDLHTVMKADSANAGAGRRVGRLRAALVAVQVALCMTLMVATGLLLRGLQVTYTVDPGFAYHDVAYVSLESSLDAYRADALAAVRSRLRDAIRALPGVEAVAGTDRVPLGADSAGIPIRLPGEGDGAMRAAQLTGVTPEYFAVLELPIVRGRTFSGAEMRPRRPDERPAARPAMISESTARNLWPDGDAIGRTLLWGDDALQVVGVAADAQVSSVGSIDPYHVYVPSDGVLLLVKSRTDLAATIASIHKAVNVVDPGLAIDVFPLEASLGWWRGISATVASLAGGLGLLALLLAAIGIYGVVSYTVTGRYREIGVRLALGATAGSLLVLLLRQTMRPVGAGAVLGLGMATALSRVLSSVLFGVSPADPIGLLAAVLLVLAVALTAGVVAARPASAADPATSLRCE